MRKKLLSVVLSCLVAVVAFAGAEDQYVLHEGFEGGVIPTGWTLECTTSYQQPWVVESGTTSEYPTGSVAGDYHVALRNQSTQTQHFVSRLISPVINIKETFQPILVFSHVQAQRAGDVDVLRVYYRTSSESRWVKIGEYTDKISRWQRDTIDLPAANETYQLAFEGTDNLGRGIALDEIIVRPMPTCDVPSNIVTDGLTLDKVSLSWSGSLDADSFLVVLADKAITDLEDLTNVVATKVATDFQTEFTNLTRNTRYYVYVKSYCGNSESDWSAVKTFTTKNLETIPYTQTFDLTYALNTVDHMPYWSYGTSILTDDGSMEYMPFVNRNTSETSLYNYSNSNTTCLVFSGARSTSSDIPEGQYVYAATPELDVQSLSNLQVTFWGTAYSYVDADYAGGLIVGVMTNPEDFTTFVPVDTVYVDEQKSFDRFTVFFDQYKGDAKYIAFASNFTDKKNIFFLDDVTVKERDAVSEVTNINISNILAGQFTVNASMNGNTQVEIIVTKDTTDSKTKSTPLTPDGLPASYILARTTTSSLPQTMNVDVTGCFVQVYVHPAGSDVYALPIKVQIPKKWNGVDTLLIDFESTDGFWSTKEIRNFSQMTYNYTLPFDLVDRGEYACGSAMWASKTTTTSTPSNQTAYKGKYGMYMTKTYQEYSSGDERCKSSYGEYIALPQCDTIQNVYLKFYMRTYSTSAKNTSRVAVGAMTDPFDYSTFDTLYIAEAVDEEWRAISYSFSGYKGTGKFPAIMVVDAEKRYWASSTSSSTESYTTYYTSSQYLDEISIVRNSSCTEPANISASVTDTTVTLTWNANGASKWIGYIYKDKAGTDTLASETLTTAAWTYKNLSSHTTYYYNIGTICESDTICSEIASFRTLCHAVEPIPYIEGFETWESSTDKDNFQPSNWTYAQYGGTSSITFYPYVYSVSLSAHTGTQCFDYYYPSGRDSALTLALPLMAEDLNKLQMTFYAKPAGVAYVGDTIFVGVMTDPNCVSTFDTVGVAVLSANSYQEFIIRFNNYKGNGKYIAFAKPLSKANRALYIDDIKVDYLSDCEKVQGVYTRNTTTTGARVHWTKGDATEWDVLLTTKEMTLGSVVATGNDSVISMTHTTTMPYTITDCPKYNTQYYVYVRSSCSETNKGEWSTPASFRTTCQAVTAGQLGLIDFSNEDELECWTVGVREGTTAAPSRNKNKYLYMFNTAASDGAYAVMPLLDIDNISKLEVSFDAHGGTGAAYLREVTVGIITSPGDLSTFNAIKTISLNRVSAVTNFDEGYRYTIPFDTYDGDYNGDYGKYIMFLSESGEKANYVYITNIKVDTIPACQKPIEVKVKPGTTDATFLFGNTTDNYRLQILNSISKKVVKDTIVADSAVVPGLDYATTYLYQAQHCCSATDTSEWSNPRKFTTECPVAFDVPYSMDFDSYVSGAGNMPGCWEGFTNSSTAYPYVYNTAKQGTSGNGFYLYRNTSYYSAAVLPKFARAIQDLTISFAYRNTNTGTWKAYLEVGVSTDISSYSALDSTFVCLDSIEMEPYKTPNNKWLQYTKMLDSYTGTEGYIVLRAPKADISANSGAVYIDNLYVEKSPSCFRPTDLNMLACSPTSVTVSWNPGNKETAWDVACVAKNGEISDATVAAVTKDTFEITGLTASTDYDVYVRANCGSGDMSDWSSKLSVTTYPVVELADAHWNFDEADKHVVMPESNSNVQEKNWMFGNTKSTAYSNIPYLYKNTYYSVGDKTRNAHYALSDTCALMINTGSSTNGAYAVLPYVNADLNTLQIRFSGRCVYATGSKVSNTDSVYNVSCASSTYQRSIKVGTLTNPYDLSTFELLTDYQFKEVTDKKTIDPNGYWEEVAVPLYGAQGKYIALLSDYSVQNRVYIDNVVIEAESGCAAPTAIKADSLGETYVGFSWKSSKKAWNVKLTDADDKVVLSEDNLTTAKWSSNALKSSTTYTFSVQAVCDAENTSAWRSVTFTTDCAKYDTATFKVGFEDDLYTYVGTGTSNQIPLCWNAGQLNKSVASTLTYMPKAVVNTGTRQNSRNLDGTSGRALQLYNYSTSYYNSYVILPELNVDMDSTSLHFWARAAYFLAPTHSTQSSKNRLSVANNSYQHSIVIGAVADVEDMTTFVAIDTFTYSQSWSSVTGVYATDDPTGNYYWEEVIIPLKKYKDKGNIVILYPGNGKTSFFYIDDMDIVAADFCSAPSNLRARGITATGAQLTWAITGVDSVQLQVATTEEFLDSTIVVDTVLTKADGQFTLEQLQSSTTYYARMLHFCSADEISDWSTITSFSTSDAVRFYEPFTEVRTYPLRWNRASAVPADIFDKDVDIATKYVATTTSANWIRSASNSDMYVATSTGGTNNYWLVTPIIDLSTIDADALSLSFKLSLTSNNSGLPNPTLADDKFIVAVSEDAGESWKSANTTYWSDAEGDNAAYSYAAIPYEGSLYHVDLTKYAGKQICIAFINSSTKTGSKNYLRLDNVSVNSVTISNYAASICRWEDYEDANFSIDAYNLVVGNTLYSRYEQATRNGVKDNYVTLNLQVLCDTVTPFQATICEGEDYTAYNFDIKNATTSGLYKQKLSGSNTCDSTVTLDLTVIPRLRSEVRQSICQGDFYTFNGEKYYTNTVHSDTLTSLVTGCDSIVTLYLTVNDILRGEADAHLCPGGSITFGKFGEITEAGTYVDTLKNAVNCDSVATLNVYMHKTETSLTRALICQGDKYSSSVWSGLGQAGDYPSKQQTVWGCDSIATLHLMVAGGDLQARDTIAVDALPYVLNGEELLPVGTAEGVYTKIVELRCGAVTMTIVVGEPTGLHSVFASSLAVAPNPVQVGQSFRVLGSFASDATLEVFSATGACIYRAMNVASPMTVPGIPLAGVYLVVVTSDNQAYQAKVVVK